MSDTHHAKDRWYIHLERFSLLYCYYAIVDVSDYYADQLFIRHQVTVRFGSEYAHPDAPYRIIFCKVRKKDEQRFLDALQELPNKMLLCGHPDYPAFCTLFFDKMEQGRALRRSGKDNHEGENRAPVRSDQETAEGSKRCKARLVERRQPRDPDRARQESL